MCEAFSDYVVPLSPTFAQFEFILAQRGYDADLSWVARVDGQIASFWLIGAAPRACPQTAYVISTGTLPSFRSKGLARQIFDTTRKHLATLGKSELSLEVIQGNASAQRLYDDLGFRPLRGLDCYTFDTRPVTRAPARSVKLRAVDLSPLRDRLGAFHDWRPSWQNSFHALMRVPRDIMAVGAFEEDRCLGYGVLLRPTSTLAQFAVSAEHRRRGIGSAIVACLAERYDALNVLNVDQTDAASRSFLESCGATISTVQVEMICPLAS